MNQRSDDSAVVPEEKGSDLEALPEELDFAASRKVKQQLLAELRSGWQAGNPVSPELLLRRWPGNPDNDPDVASLLFEDYCQRRNHGARPDSAEYEQRFPDHKDSLASLSRHHDLLRSLGGSGSAGSLLLALPSVGDVVFGFRLCRELGRGSFACVFLAEQIGLAGRPVVVKVSAIEGDEPQTLAQLQHTNIVPIYSVHEDAAAALRVVCMPYFGGSSLSRVLEAVWAETELPAGGMELVQALAVVSGPGRARPAPSEGGRISNPSSDTPPTPPQSDTSPLALLGRLPYERAAAWIVLQLAEALQHAHQRGVHHRDIKPSNVLLGSDGEPMLLDFNLSQNFNSAQAQVAATLGGTVAYMAPEHLRALAGRDPALARLVDERADIYGLGMVLYEMLTGRRPFDQSGSYSPMPALIEAMAVERGRAAPSLRERRPDVSWTLESIARQCLAPDPAQRYQRADHLAEDLRCYLEDRRLRYAPELSWRERGTKWVRRHPRLAVIGPVIAAAGLLLVVGGLVLAGVRQQLHASQARAYEAEGAEARQQMQAFVEGAERARCLLNTTTDLREHVSEGVAVCEKTLALYDILHRSDWQEHTRCQRLQPKEQRQLAEDARELLLLLARARVRQAPTRADPDLPQTVAATLTGLGPAPLPHSSLVSWAAGQQVWKPRADQIQRTLSGSLREALAILDRAESIEGLESSTVLWQDRASYLERRGEHTAAANARGKAQALPPHSARDHYLLASHYSQNRQWAKALAELKQALALNPRHYWTWFNLGTCHYDRHEYTLAVGAYSACIALWPEFAWGYFNRGHTLHHLGLRAEAAADYTAALDRDPNLTDAAINRGLLYLDSGRPTEALADFERAVAAGVTSVIAHAGRGISLEGLGRHAEADEAFRQAWTLDPNHVDMLLGYGFAIAERRPEDAQAAFLKVIERQPRTPRAFYGYAMLLARRVRDSAEALACLDLALQLDPMFVEARQARAVVLAHQGKWDWARREIDWCVKAQPRGATLYAAACVYALIAEKSSAEEGAPFANRAVELLREAFGDGYGKDKAAADCDLAGLGRHPGFRSLLQQARTARLKN
jgi:serine/threonine protein kinase/Tfp pilus assembly protein PilF